MIGSFEFDGRNITRMMERTITALHEVPSGHLLPSSDEMMESPSQPFDVASHYKALRPMQNWASHSEAHQVFQAKPHSCVKDAVQNAVKEAVCSGVAGVFTR